MKKKTRETVETAMMRATSRQRYEKHIGTQYSHMLVQAPAGSQTLNFWQLRASHRGI